MRNEPADRRTDQQRGEHERDEQRSTHLLDLVGDTVDAQELPCGVKVEVAERAAQGEAQHGHRST